MKNDGVINSLITYNVNENVNRRVFFNDFAYNCINLFFVSQVVAAVSPGLSALGRERLDEAVQLLLIWSEDDDITSCLLNNVEIALRSLLTHQSVLPKLVNVGLFGDFIDKPQPTSTFLHRPPPASTSRTHICNNDGSRIQRSVRIAVDCPCQSDLILAINFKKTASWENQNHNLIFY